jgi:benzoylsuccinyl-CoA thiolase BbsB subunit
MRDVYVLGTGQTVFTKQKDIPPSKLGETAATAALADAGLDPRKLEVAYASHCEGPSQQIEDIMKRVGCVAIEMQNVENACASGGAAAHLLWKDIAYGAYDIGIAVGVDSLTRSKLSSGLIPTAEGDLNGLMGITMPGQAALNARRLMETRDMTLEDLAYASIKNHRNAVMNPYAHYRKAITFEDIQNAKMISDPITVLHCCPQSDGAAAVIFGTKEEALKLGVDLVKIEASAFLSAPYESWDEDVLDAPLIRLLADTVYEKAGVDPMDVDVVELHDAFSPEELYAYEVMRICGPGETKQFIRDGHAEIGGRCAVNPSGGLQSLGHPLGASGVRVICEIATHLRGKAGERQQPNAKVGLAQMVGGGLVGLSAPAVGYMSILSR